MKKVRVSGSSKFSEIIGEAPGEEHLGILGEGQAVGITASNLGDFVLLVFVDKGEPSERDAV